MRAAKRRAKRWRWRMRRPCARSRASDGGMPDELWKRSRMNAILAALQRLGRALMLPIAVLPIAGLLLRLGQGDLLDIPFLAASGAAVFGHLGLVFAIG